MSRNDRYQLLQELDPDEVTDISDAHKKMLLAQGLKPFRTSHNKIKWANTATQIYKLGQQNHKFHFFPKKRMADRPNRIRKRHRSRLVMVLRDNWVFFMVLALIIVILLYILNFHVIA